MTKADYCITLECHSSNKLNEMQNQDILALFQPHFMSLPEIMTNLIQESFTRYTYHGVELWIRDAFPFFLADSLVQQEDLSISVFTVKKRRWLLPLYIKWTRKFLLSSHFPCMDLRCALQVTGVQRNMRNKFQSNIRTIVFRTKMEHIK